MADAMREKVTAAVETELDRDFSVWMERWGNPAGIADDAPDPPGRYSTSPEKIASATLEACHFEELCRALRSIEGFPKAAEQTGHNGDYLRGLELPAGYARAVLAKVKDEGHG